MQQPAEPVTVIFVCSNCDDCFEAIQTQTPTAGIFQCTSCRKIVHHWDGAFHYINWRRIDPTAY